MIIPSHIRRVKTRQGTKVTRVKKYSKKVPLTFYCVKDKKKYTTADYKYVTRGNRNFAVAQHNCGTQGWRVIGAKQKSHPTTGDIEPGISNLDVFDLKKNKRLKSASERWIWVDWKDHKGGLWKDSIPEEFYPEFERRIYSKGGTIVRKKVSEYRYGRWDD